MREKVKRPLISHPQNLQVSRRVLCLSYILQVGYTFMFQFYVPWFCFNLACGLLLDWRASLVGFFILFFYLSFFVFLVLAFTSFLGSFPFSFFPSFFAVLFFCLVRLLVSFQSILAIFWCAICVTVIINLSRVILSTLHLCYSYPCFLWSLGWCRPDVARTVLCLCCRSVV